jgi:uncharacterized protein DUF6049
VSKRWASTALCTLALGAAALVGTVGGAVPPLAPPASAAGSATAHAPAEQALQARGPELSLVSQTPWVTPAEPWFNLALGISPGAGPANGLYLNFTFSGRLDNASQLQQAISGTPPTSTLLHDPDVPVSAVTGGLGATACVTVVQEESVTPPATGPGVCAAGSPTLVLGCPPDTVTCGDVYPVTVALLRQGSSTPLAHLTTFLTFDEPEGPPSPGGPLRVGVVVPVNDGGVTTAANALAAYRDVPTTLVVSPLAMTNATRVRDHADTRALSQLETLNASDEILDQSYVPINVAALSEAGLHGEINAQVQRGDELLRTAGLRPDEGPWVDTTTAFSQGDAPNLASGLQVAGAPQLVLSDNDLAAAGRANYTFAQPFTLDLRGSSVPAAAVDSTLSARFTADANDPVLGAEQLLASLAFVHYENATLPDQRGVVVAPPAGWRPSAPFLETLLGGLSAANPTLSAVTLTQLFAQVPIGGNDEPSVRHLQSGPATRGITHNAATRIALARQQLGSFSLAVDGHPADLTALSDALLATEARGLSPSGRAAALTAYDKAFASETGKITLATERTVTFTAQRAAIPVTVLSAAPYPVRVVVTLTSDKFTFPDGSTRSLVLDRPTTSVRVTAQARTSGDRLPIEVTLHTPNGGLVLAHTVLTVHSTAISFAGVALTVLAGAVLLVWWVRTWRRSRRARARAH